VPSNGHRSGIGAVGDQVLTQLDNALPDCWTGEPGLRFRSFGSWRHRSCATGAIPLNQSMDPLTGDPKLGSSLGDGQALIDH